MLLELAIFTGVATAATIGPVYKIKRGLSKLFRVPLLGFLMSIAYSLFTGMILLNIFAFQSSVAGLANLLSSIIFTIWLYMESKK